MYYKHVCMCTYINICMYGVPCGLHCVSVRVRVVASTVSSTAHLDHGRWNSRYIHITLVLIVATNSLCVHRIRTCE